MPGRHFVDGGWVYSGRLALLPWSAPVLLYCRALATRWPAQERRLRACAGPVHPVRVACYLAVGCHCLRTLSWSSLLLALAVLTAALPALEARICGRAPE